MKYARRLPNGRLQFMPAHELNDLTVKNRHLRSNAASARMSGKYPRPPEACPKCGATGVQMDSHHADYAKPYDVEWFCHPCHMRHHRDLRDAAARSLGYEVRLSARERAVYEASPDRVRAMETAQPGVE